MGNGNNLIAWANAEGSQRQVKRVGAISNTHARLRFTISGKILLETAHRFATDKGAAVDDVLDGRVNFRFDVLVLVEKTDEWNLVCHLFFLV